MSMKQLNQRLEQMFEDEDDSPHRMIEELDEIFKEYGIRQVNTWRYLSRRTKNTLLHELVQNNSLDVVRHVLSKYELRTFFKRESDQLTPIELAQMNKNRQMIDLLMEFTDEQMLIKQQQRNNSKMNIIWMDLELTSFHKPQILECAVIITDKDLNEIQRKQWIIHFDEEIIRGLEQWHQDTFKDIDDGGNGLFRDVLNSRITKQQMEEELLDLLKSCCPEKACPLGGSSIHTDREVLKIEMPSVYSYLHHRVIDVSSFSGMMKRWAPRTESKFKKQLNSNTQTKGPHRAMADIQWSIEMMKLFRPLLTSRIKETMKAKDERECSGDDGRKEKNLLLAIDQLNLDDDDQKDLLKRIEFDQTFNLEQLQLSEENERIYKSNPHLREVFLNDDQLIYHSEKFTDEDRHLSSPSSMNESIKIRSINTTEYWKDRQILLSEIEFLSKYSCQKNCLVIYIGGTPGRHLNCLISLFPHIHFIFFDQNKYLLTQTSQIEIKSEDFTDQLAQKYSKETNCYLICNLSTTRNQEEMINQMKWHEILQPRVSLLTFHFPDNHLQSTYEYLQGDLILPLWSSKQLNECRLIVQQDSIRISYKREEFEKSMNYFYSYQRTKYYSHNFDHIQNEGLDHCYDCTCEIWILQNYFRQIKSLQDQKQIYQSIAQLSHRISQDISSKRRSLNIIPKR